MTSLLARVTEWTAAQRSFFSFSFYVLIDAFVLLSTLSLSLSSPSTPPSVPLYFIHASIQSAISHQHTPTLTPFALNSKV